MLENRFPSNLFEALILELGSERSLRLKVCESSGESSGESFGESSSESSGNNLR